MAATLLVPFLPAGLTGLIAKLSPAMDEPDADPAGYSLTDTESDGRYMGSIPPYSGQQPEGRYWCRVFRPNKTQPAFVGWVDLVDGSSAEIGVVRNQQLEDVSALVAADQYIDKTKTPWEIVYVERGTQVELLRQQLRDINGDPVTKISTFVASRTTPTTTQP